MHSDQPASTQGLEPPEPTLYRRRRNADYRFLQLVRCQETYLLMIIIFIKLQISVSFASAGAGVRVSSELLATSNPGIALLAEGEAGEGVCRFGGRGG